MIVRDALQLASQLHHSDSPRLDAELLLAQVLGKPRTFLYTWPDHPLSEAEQIQYQQWLGRRAVGEPIAHILGQREFWSLSLEVNASTLIPRPDTEVLVEQVLARIENPAVWSGRILDLGTGTGAIAMALASELPQAHVIGIDFSDEAVALARRNGQRLNFHNVEFIQSDWYQAAGGQFEFIVSNPPYIDSEDEHLNSGDVRFEPRTALVAGDHGLADLQAIIAGAPENLSVNGWLLVEHGWQQAEVVRQKLEAAGFRQVFTAKDYSGNERVSGGQWRDG